MVDLREKQFKVAFSVQKHDYNDNPSDDPDFVEWVAYYGELNGDGRFLHLVNLHKCTEEDYSEFHQIVDY